MTSLPLCLSRLSKTNCEEEAFSKSTEEEQSALPSFYRRLLR
jgi:hypothetical protein